MKDFIIIGAAQAGLSMAYHLKKNQKDFLIIDKEDEIGASWLNRWNSLNTLAERIEKEDNYFIVKTNKGDLNCKEVIVATGPFHIPYTPKFHNNLSEDIFQIHSNYYKNPKQLKDGATLVVGGGDSGFQILDEISEQTNKKTYFSGNTDIKTLPQELLGKTLWWWFTATGFLSFSKDSWVGKKISKSKQPIIGTDVKSIIKRDNVIPVGYTINAENHTIKTTAKELDDVKNIVWATGYKPNFEWIETIELKPDGYPKHHRGISTTKGLYFIGLPWLHTRGSATLGGIKKDAKHLANKILKS